jgi:hypothetical protein
LADEHLRSAGAKSDSFETPGAGTPSGLGNFVTYTNGINQGGAIAGGYADARGMFHGFVRNPEGTFATFDPPGSVFPDKSRITPNGTVTSFYLDPNSALHGYV